MTPARFAPALAPTLLLVVETLGWGVAAQTDERCKVASFRRAASTFGANASITVVNDGQPCSFTRFVDPGSRTPPDQIRVVTPPGNGTLTLTQPGTIRYTPNPGFVGSDTCAFAGSGRSRTGGNLVNMSVNMTATVLPGPAAPQKP